MCERTKEDRGSKIRRISWMRLRQREDVKIRKYIKNVAGIESGWCMREPEADVDKHCHLTNQAELSAKGHMIYGH